MNDVMCRPGGRGFPKVVGFSQPFNCSQSLLAAAVAMVIASQPVSAQSGAPEQNAAALDEVVVTAQRRSELSVNVPISITAIGADQLGKGDVQQLGDIMKLTPGLRFDNLGANSQPTIRGVGTSVVVAGAGSNVALYADGFYSPNPLMADSDLLNVESVQVLKGPQGTLFGRNATGGAILVTTSEPSSTAGAALEASYGSYNTQRYSLYATGGASETLAFDVAGLYRSSDGYLDNIITGSDTDGEYENKAIRLGARWEVTDKASVLLRYTHAKTDDPSSIAASPYYANGVVDSSAALFGAKVADKPYDVSNGFKPAYTSEADATQLTVKADLDVATLTSYTQYRDETGTHYYDFDMSSLELYHYIFETTDKIFTQEFLLSSTGDNRLRWTAGFFYFVDQTKYPHNRASQGGSAFVPFGGSGIDTRSIAVFGDAAYELQDNLYLTVGLRYSEDKSTNGYFIDNASGAKINLSDLDDDQLTPRVALRYSLDEHSNIYASYSEGYKSGILNVAANSTTGIEVKPEKINAYEVGYKYSSGAASLDVSAFYYDYKNLQVVSYVQTDTIIKNAADSTVYGLDMQTRYAFTDRLSANLGLAYLDAKYDKFEGSQVRTQCLDQVQCGQGYGLYLTSDSDASGFQMQRSPELTGTLGVNYGIDVASGVLEFSGTLYHTSSFYFDSSEHYKQDAYDLLSARAAWTAPADHYTLAVYADNLTNEEYRSQVLPQAFGPLTTWGAPRTFGISLGINY